jgi:hypothetical protein
MREVMRKRERGGEERERESKIRERESIRMCVKEKEQMN